METNELQCEIVGQVKKWHTVAEDLARDAKDSAAEALNAATMAGQYLEDARKMTGGRLLAWLRDNVPDLTPERAKAYLSLFHTKEQRKEIGVDHRQLLLLGIVDQQSRDANPSAGDGDPRWVSQVGSVRGWFDKLEKARPVASWPCEEREAVADQLKPLVDFYNKLRGGG